MRSVGTTSHAHEIVHRGVTSISLKKLLSLEIPPRKMLLSPWLPQKGLAMIHATRGIGKTWLSLSIAVAVASGHSLLGWNVEESCKVLYVDGEMSGADLKSRLGDLVGPGPRDLPIHVVAHDLQPHGIPDLATPSGQSEINRVIDVKDCGLVILDNLSCLLSSGRENEADDWAPVQRWLLDLRRKGVSVLLIHHSGKRGRQRGSSRREDVLDTVIALREPVGLEVKDGATFEVHFEKGRGLCGKDAWPFVAQLTTVDNRMLWKRTIPTTNNSKAIEMLRNGEKQASVAKQLKVDPGTVSRWKKVAVQNGVLPERSIS